MKKFLFTTFMAITIILSIILIVPVNAETSVTVENAKVETLSGGNISKDEAKKEVTITLTSEEINKLTWYEKDAPTYDEDVTRPGNGWWIGFRLTLPSNVTPSEVTRDVTNVYGASDSKPFNADDNTTDVCSYWAGIDENKLEGKTSEFTLATYKFHWDSKKTDDLTVIIRVNPESVKLTKDPSKMVTVKINDTAFTLLKDKNLTADADKGGLTEEEVKKLNKLMEPEEGYKFVGLFIKGSDEKFDLEQTISNDMELEVRFEKEEEKEPDIKPQDPTINDKPVGDPATTQPAKEEPAKQQETQTQEPQAQQPTKDTTPKTSSTNFELFAIVVAMASLVGITIFKKNK